MNKTRLSFYYLAGYLTIGGLALLFFPTPSAKLFLSNVEYDPMMLRMSGMFMLGIAIIIIQFIRHEVTVLYSTTLVVRSIFLVCLAVFYFTSGNPFFLVILAIVALGFVLTGLSFLSDRRAS
jgi:uncharacterized protein YjeT (DUF2065 family)